MVLDPNKIGLPVLVSVGVVLEKSTPESFSAFEIAAQETPEILEYLLLAGEFDYILKIRVKDISSFNKLYATKLLSLPGIKKLLTFFVLKEIKTNCNLIF